MGCRYGLRHDVSPAIRVVMTRCHCPRTGQSQATFSDRSSMQRYGHHRRPFLDATSYSVLVALLAIRGFGLLQIPFGCDPLMVSTAVADDAANENQYKPSDLIDLRVELLWASQTPRRWGGAITWDATASQASQPKISSPVLLTSGPIWSAAVFQTDQGGLIFGPPTRLKMVPSGEGTLASVQTQSGGVSFRVQGRKGDRATLRIDGEDVPQGFSTSFRIDDLINGKAIDAMVNNEASITIRRVAVGDLRVRLGNSETIFWTDQKVDVSLINPTAMPAPGLANSLVLDCYTYSAADDSLVSTASFPVTQSVDGLQCPEARWVSPSENGAYRLRFRLRDTSQDRSWLSTALSPTTMANSISRSITTSLPQSLITPLNIPLSPFNALSGNAASPQTAAARDSGSTVAPSLGGPTISGLHLLPVQESIAIAETTLSIAVIASPHEMPLIGQSTTIDETPQSKSFSDDASGWARFGSAELRNDSSTVSRLFIQPTAEWFGGTPVGNRTGQSLVHHGQRLIVIDSGQQLEFSIPIKNVGVRHRAVIRVPSQTSLRLVAELVDLDPTTGVPQPLGPGLSIIRTSKQTSPAAENLQPNLQEAAQASSVDSPNMDEHESWHEAVIDFWPRSPATRLVLSNRSTIMPAGIGRVNVMVNESERLRYPLAKQNRPATGGARLSAMRLEIADLFEQFGDRGLPTTARPLDYQLVWVATNRLIETLHREGYGGVILTVSSDGVSLFPDRGIVADAAWNANWANDAGPVDPLRLMLRMFERESLQLIPCIRPSTPALALEQKIRSATIASSIAARSPLAGQLGAWSFDGPPLTAFPIYNGGNETVFSEFKRSLLELNERCRDRGCVPALGILADERSYLRSPPLPIADEQTLNEFHASLGQNAPPRELLEMWIQKSGENAFQRWRADRLASGFQQILDQIDGRSLLLMSCDSALPPNLVELGRDRRIITTRLQRRGLTEPLALRVRDEACNTSVPVSMAGGPPPQAYLAAIFHQPVSDAQGFEPGPFVSEKSAGQGDLDLPSDPVPAARPVAAPSLPGVTALLDPIESSLAMAHLVNRSDRSIVAIGGGGINQPASDVRRRSLRTFAELPPVMMFDVESKEKESAALRVRMATYHDETYVYAVNQTRWPVVWQAILTRPATVHRLGPPPPQRSVALGRSIDEDPLRDAAKNQKSPTDSLASNRPIESGTSWQTVVEGGELVAVRFSSSEAKLVNWRSTFAGSASQIATIRAGVEDAVSAISERQYLRRRNLIFNASFEAQGTGVPGWMIAQYPADCVAIDSSVAFDGARSIRLTGKPGRVGGSWIVSQTIVPPRSGRLAISARFRGGSAKDKKPEDDTAEPFVVRMAIEGTVGGTPIRKSKSVTLEADGKWSEPQWLEIAKLPNLPVESLRLTIDLMSAGEVWVDDIECYDHFMTAAEKTHWEHLVFLAAGGLSRGDCVGASRLFDSQWALDLVNPSPTGNRQSPSGSPVRRAAFNPSVTAETVESATDSPVPVGQVPPSKIKQPTPRTGWTDRLKSWIPRSLRFGS